MTNKETANHIRASVINCCLDVEDAITLTHGHWYSKSREDGVLSTNRLVIDLLADLGFEKKINLYIGFVKEFPNEFSKSMIKDLNEIRSVRNQLVIVSNKYTSNTLFLYVPLNRSTYAF
jgi:hypothetical protein